MHGQMGEWVAESMIARFRVSQVPSMPFYWNFPRGRERGHMVLFCRGRGCKVQSTLSQFTAHDYFKNGYKGALRTSTVWNGVHPNPGPETQLRQQYVTTFVIRHFGLSVTGFCLAALQIH